MDKPTHVYTINGGPSNVLNAINKTYEEMIRHMVELLDGSSKWAFCLWRVTGELNHLDPTTWLAGEGEYIQCAGSAEGLTVEVRFIDTEGKAHQVVLGREHPIPEGEPTESISWDNGRYTAKVYTNEVFTPKEAATLFVDYYSNGSRITGPYFGREITI